MLVKFEGVNGEPIYLNPALVASVVDAGDNCCVHVGGSTIWVKGQADAAAAQIHHFQDQLREDRPVPAPVEHAPAPQEAQA